MREPRVEQFMTPSPHTIEQEQSLSTGYRLLREHGIRHLPVLHGGKLVGILVHDLKNPVNTLDLHAQLLLRDPSVQGRARESVQHIRDEARALSRLILNLLDISKSGEGQPGALFWAKIPDAT
jgi:signal transduction histidine kinase